MENGKNQQSQSGAVPYVVSPATMLLTALVLTAVFALVLVSAIKLKPSPDDAVQCSELCEPHGVLRWDQKTCTCQESRQGEAKINGET